MKESKLPIKIKAHHGYDVEMLNEQGLYKEATRVFDYDKRILVVL